MKKGILLISLTLMLCLAVGIKAQIAIIDGVVYVNYTTRDVDFNNAKEVIDNGWKFSNNSGIIFSAPSELQCDWFDNGPLKYCNTVVEVTNRDGIALSLNGLKYTFSGLEKYNPVIEYSTDSARYFESQEYKDENDTLLLVVNVERYSWERWKKVADSVVLPERYAIRAGFYMPKYERTHYNFTLEGLAGGFVPIRYDLDPEVGECGTLTENNRYYNLTRNLNSSGDCMTITASDVIFDCNGFNITYGKGGTANSIGIDSFSGSNKTIKNCKIDEGSLNCTTSCAAISAGTSETVLNNTIYVTRGVGILLASNSHTIENNTVYTQQGNCITVGSRDVNTIKGNILNSTEGYSGTPYGIYLSSGSTNNTITNNYIWAGGAGSSDAAVYMSNSDDNTFINNTIISSSAAYALYVTTGSQRNYFYNNTIIQKTAILALDVIGGSSENVFDKIYVESSSSTQTALFGGTQGIIINNSVFNNTANGYALDFSTQSGNFTVENTLLKATNDYALHMQNINGINAAGANNSLFRNVEIITETINGIHFNTNVSYGRYIGLNVTSGSDDYAILFTGMNHTRFEDSVFKGFATSDMRIDYPLVNLSFINCTYTRIVPIGTWGPGNSETYWTREWWWRGYAKDTYGNPIEGASIEIYNSTGHLQNNMTTGANGYTARMNLIEYRANNSLKFFYASPYTFNATKGGYTDADITNWNWSTNNMTFEITLGGVEPPVVGIVYNVSTTDSMSYNEAVNKINVTTAANINYSFRLADSLAYNEALRTFVLDIVNRFNFSVADFGTYNEARLYLFTDVGEIYSYRVADFGTYNEALRTLYADIVERSNISVTQSLAYSEAGNMFFVNIGNNFTYRVAEGATLTEALMAQFTDIGTIYTFRVADSGTYNEVGKIVFTDLGNVYYFSVADSGTYNEALKTVYTDIIVRVNITTTDSMAYNEALVKSRIVKAIVTSYLTYNEARFAGITGTYVPPAALPTLSNKFFFCINIDKGGRMVCWENLFG